MFRRRLRGKLMAGLLGLWGNSGNEMEKLEKCKRGLQTGRNLWPRLAENKQNNARMVKEGEELPKRLGCLVLFVIHQWQIDPS